MESFLAATASEWSIQKSALGRVTSGRGRSARSISTAEIAEESIPVPAAQCPPMAPSVEPPEVKRKAPSVSCSERVADSTDVSTDHVSIAVPVETPSRWHTLCAETMTVLAKLQSLSLTAPPKSREDRMIRQPLASQLALSPDL